AVLAEVHARLRTCVARVLVAAGAVAAERLGAVRLACGGAGSLGAVAGQGTSVGGPQGKNRSRDHGGDHRRGDGTRAQTVPAGCVVLRVHRETPAVEAGDAATGGCGMRHRALQNLAGHLENGEFGGSDAGAGPAAGNRALRGTAAPGAVVDVPDELAA